MRTSTAEIDARLKELRAAFAKIEQENDEILKTASKSEDGVLLIDNARREAFSKNLAKLREIKAEREMLEEQKQLREWGAGPERDPVSVEAGASGAVAKLSGKSLGQLFVESDEFKAMKAAGSATMPSKWIYRGVDITAANKGLAFSGVQTKDVYTAAPTGPIAGGFAPLQRDEIVVQAMRRQRVRDLFPTQTTDAGIIEFFRVTGFVANNAASVVPERSGSDFGLKPHTNLSFESAQAPVRTIAHWEVAHRNVLDDVPQLRGIIDTELLYGLRLAEDNQILNGTGTGEDLLGILNTPGVQSYTQAGSDNKADAIRRAATKAILAYYEPTGVVLHPSDWESIELLKDGQGAYIIAVAVAVGAEQRIWRLNVVDSPAIAQGTGLVGAFGLGASLYDRMEASIRVAEQHGDFFLRNAIVILAEERLALAVKRPESFVKVTFS